MNAPGDTAAGATDSEHEDEAPHRAPGDLELVRSFLSLHDHEGDRPESLPPAASTIEAWLRHRRLVAADEQVARPELDRAMAVQRALRTRVLVNTGADRDPAADDELDRAAAAAGLRPRFRSEDRLQPEATGVDGAVGRLLAIAFLAELDGSFRRLRACQDPACTSILFDRSRNRSARWCSMAVCGNRNKVRRFRERERAVAHAEADGGDGARRP